MNVSGTKERAIFGNSHQINIREVQVLSLMIELNKYNDNPNNPSVVLKQTVQIQEKNKLLSNYIG